MDKLIELLIINFGFTQKYYEGLRSNYKVTPHLFLNRTFFLYTDFIGGQTYNFYQVFINGDCWQICDRDDIQLSIVYNPKMHFEDMVTLKDYVKARIKN